MDKQDREILERIAVSLEKLAEDPQIEIEAGPPMCPNCGKLNPQITIFQEDKAEGQLGEWILEAECHHCNSPIFGWVESWSLHRMRETLIQELQERAEHGNHGTNNDQG